ncbi:MAG: hypothetical protein R2874_12290 [Desulfobacterales bacterium]
MKIRARSLEDHYYNPTYQGLIDIGVEPHFLTEEVMEGMFQVVEQHMKIFART